MGNEAFLPRVQGRLGFLRPSFLTFPERITKHVKPVRGYRAVPLKCHLLSMLGGFILCASARVWKMRCFLHPTSPCLLLWGIGAPKP